MKLDKKQNLQHFLFCVSSEVCLSTFPPPTPSQHKTDVSHSSPGCAIDFQMVVSHSSVAYI